ncbi:maleylpyruvate isomerase family mycothiol-dependent enzyme [Streptomyces gulbargensis]|uniref:Maleylpyruvate isomerase family mycothiol-dependent enzyme n=1 Tax=Streptomyces gulbargensis TaxID=364901 RepID=A0ABP7MCL6_9ACTN
MQETLDFPDLLRLIDERSAAFRAAVASAPDLGAQVPTCPEWTLFDLAQHLGEGRRAWAATIGAGPDAAAKVPAPRGDATAPREREALLVWLAESTRLMLEALRAAGPDRGCWAWWGTSQSPKTCGAVARHQLHEIAVHTYDAQLTVGAPEALREEVALDGVEEFVFTLCTTTKAWPHEPAVIEYRAAEGRSWRNWLSGDGARAARLSATSLPPAATAEEVPEVIDASIEGPASELVLAFYGRVPLESLKVDDSRGVFDLFVAWEPE